ncbi:hypothetical protein [Pseudomonas sp. NBRC 111124]|uniref:hypothetical protein n=1 Tax=Pseudomonas sp. NBRC 111124 TaxID=1661039 RepID=UPI0007619F46|nr:hypothetical protein [Pseudomonas sp. NBRC 111124]
MQRKQDTSSTPQLKAAEQLSDLKATGQSALWDLQADMGHFEWFGSLMWAIMREAEEARPTSMGVIKDLASIGNYLAVDRANILCGVCARLEASLEGEGGEQ